MGEHFVLAELLKSISDNSSQARSAEKPQAETAEEISTTFARSGQLSLEEQDSRPAPQAAKKKKKKKGKIIIAGAGLEGFVDWVDPNVSDPTKEMEDDMSSLATGFVDRMRKRAASAQGELLLVLKYMAKSVQSSLAQMKRLRRV